MGHLGRYEIHECLGRGAVGHVYSGRDECLQRDVAIKLLWLHLLGGSTDGDMVLQRFRVEASAAAQLSHPNIVKVYDFAERPEFAYIVMELVRGLRLTEYTAGRSAAEKLSALRQVAAALDYAHSFGIYHRDVKPANVLVNSDGVAKLADFGLAKMRSVSGITLRGMLVGTFHYLPPEQLRSEFAGARSDQYSLAAMAYEVLTGRPPLEAATEHMLLLRIVSDDPRPASAANRDVPETADLVLARALSKNPGERFTSCSEFMAELSYAVDPPRQWRVPSIAPPPKPNFWRTAVMEVTRRFSIAS
ncbi:MAG TPA: hypothetical protein DEH78_03705 [Solibacterales bacterium]|nr:hypothetical protein [Bryobacterales bacterium]